MVFIVQIESRTFRLVCCQPFDISLGVPYVRKNTVLNGFLGVCKENA